MARDEEEKVLWSSALEQGRALKISVSARSSGAPGPIGLAKLHRREKSIALQIQQAYPFHRVRVEIDPNTGTMQAYVMANAAYVELQREGGQDSAGEGLVHEGQPTSEQVRSAHLAAGEVVRKLEARQIRHYEDVEAAAGADAGAAFNAALTQSHRRELHLTYADGQTTTIGGKPKLPRELFRRDVACLTVDVEEVNRVRGTARLKILEGDGEYHHEYVVGRTYVLRPRTRSDVQCLKMLAHAMAMRMRLRIEVAESFNIRQRLRRTVWIRWIDQQSVLEHLRKDDQVESSSDAET